MNTSRTVLLAGVLSLFSPPLFCASISVLIIETGLRDGISVHRGKTAEIWETGLMDVFFEEGHIVTNAPALALENKPGKELIDILENYITEAEDSGIGYFVLVCLNYETAADTARSSGLPKPADIEIKLFHINPAPRTAQSAAQSVSKCVWAQSIDLIDPGRDGSPAGNEQARARKAARSLIAHLGDTI